MIGTIIGAIVVGLIVGALARLIMPGKQNIGVIMTVALGAVGSFVGTWVTYRLGYSNENGGFEIIGGKGDEIGVGAVTEYDGLLLERLAQSPDIVTQTGCGLEVEVLGSLLHALFEIFDQLVRAAGEEVAEIFDDLSMLLGADSPDAGRRALVDVAEQTRPADLVVPFEDSGRARSCGKDS